MIVALISESLLKPALSSKPNYSPAKVRDLFGPLDLQSARKISCVLYLQQLKDLFLWLLGAAWGMKGRVTAADTKARFCECSKTEAKWPCYAQLQEGSFRRITVITVQALTWAAAVRWRWMTIKPLPPDTPQGLHSSKQLSTLPLQQPAQQHVTLSEGSAALKSSVDLH